MGVYRQPSLRALAPASLALFAIAFLVIVIASLTGGDSSSSHPERVQTAQTQKRQGERKKTARKPVRRTGSNARFYTVRAGDNLSTIATKTGVSVDTLLELNPSLDPQGLVNGQRLKLPGGVGATGATGATGTTGPG
jgi:LysM repeat protein